ncbi:hypothetical protein F5Y07DRAFT_302183 [Xylaria sp. FL0933]|nr:hypothetical protein F5Y07DRAFT_302183 [Xylaria sp. FL0933]
MAYDDNAQSGLAQVHTPLSKVSNKQELQRNHSKPPTDSEEICTCPQYARPTANSSARKRASKPPSSSSSSLSSSQSRFYPRTTPSHLPDIAATNSKDTARLWKSVMTYLDDTKSSRGKRATPSATESVTSLSTSSSATAPRKAGAKVTDADFMESVLEPYGITIQKGTAQDLSKHFGITESLSDSSSRLKTYKEKFTLSVWLEPNIEAIQQEYAAMKMDSCNESEYSTFALSNLFRNEPRLPVLPEESGDQRWLPIRTVQLVRDPTPDGWLSPPPIPGRKPPKRYDWDIRTDCTYHVSVQAFQPGFRALVEEHTSVVQQRAFCPYLTVEFKKDEQDLNTAYYRVAVASAISLYNRFRLKSVMLGASRDKDSWSEEDKSQMRHYGITFTESSWKLWCTRPKTFPEWTGCVMSSIHTGNCCSLAGTQKLVDIINDIHYWGLEVHGKSCKADITARVRAYPQADETDITILE